MLKQIRFFDRRKEATSSVLNDRRIGERRRRLQAFSPERRRPIARMRTLEREEICLPVRLMVEDRMSMGHTVNFSSGGFLFVNDLPLKVGVPLSIKVRSASNQFFLNVEGNVVFTRLADQKASGHTIGVQFSLTNPFDWKLIDSAVQLFQMARRKETEISLDVSLTEERLSNQRSRLPRLYLVNGQNSQRKDATPSKVSLEEVSRSRTGSRNRDRRFTANPSWVIEFNNALEPFRQAILQSRLVQETSAGELSLKQIRAWNIQFYPFIESFPHFMAMNLSRVSDRLSRSFLIDNIRVEKRHADQWIEMAYGFGVTEKELFNTPVLAEIESLTHWMWAVNTRRSVPEAIAATHYAIEGVTQGIASIMVKGFDKYQSREGVCLERKAYQWMEAHTRYDDLHPFEALEIIKHHATSAEMQEKVTHAAQRSLEYLYVGLEACYVAFA